MKILHLTKKYPNALGGDAVVISNLEKRQRQSGNEVVILTSNCDDIINAPHVYKFGLKDTPAALDNITPKRLISLMALFFKSFVMLRNIRPEIIHTHSVDMAFFISFAARLYTIPIIHTFHIVTFSDAQQSLIRRKTELFFARGSGAKLFTAPNQDDIDALSKEGLPARLLPNGVDITYWRNSSVKQKPSERRIQVVAYGRIEQQKGIEFLIEAAKRSGGKYDIAIYGNGSQRTMLEAKINQHGLKHVQFYNAAPPDMIREILADCDIVVIPSLYETTPLTLLEAWAVGKPVIMTPVGIAKVPASSAAQATLQVAIADSSALASAIDKLASDQNLRQKLITLGSKEVAQFDWIKIEMQLVQYYHEVVA